MIAASVRPRLGALYAEGSERAFALLRRLPADGLCVVGTREASRSSVSLVYDSIRQLAASSSHGTRSSRPVIILSGFARGIDAAAHQAALDSGLPSIAILGTAIDRTYPSEHARLRDRLLEAGGLVLSELAPGTRAQPYHFVLRNRWLAALAQGVWMVQAGERSGALGTVSWALELGRSVWATPAFPHAPGFEGNQRCLREGAHPWWDATSAADRWPALATLAAGDAADGAPRAVDSAPTNDVDKLLHALTHANRERDGDSGVVLATLARTLLTELTLERFQRALLLSVSQGRTRIINGRVLINTQSTD